MKIKISRCLIPSNIAEMICSVQPMDDKFSRIYYLTWYEKIYYKWKWHREKLGLDKWKWRNNEK